MAFTCMASANAADDYWQKHHCTRSLPEAALVKKGVKGHTFKIIKKRGEALETATIGGEKITIIHFGCEGTGWQIRIRIKNADKYATASGVYDRARNLLKSIEPSATELPGLTEAISVIDSYTAPARGTPALSERLVAVHGEIETSVSVSTAAEGADTWLTVMIYTGPT
jgi:hypothetical protein